MGHVTPGSEPATKATKFQIAAQNNLLNDEGSSSYKDWLSKSTTLEDIYRHYDQAQNRIDGEIIEEDDRDEEFDEEYNGHMTGYVYPAKGHGEAPVKHRGHTGVGTYYAGGGGYSYPNPAYHNGGGSGNHHGGSEAYPHGGGSGYHSGGGSSYPHGGLGYHHSGGSGFSHEDHNGYGGAIYSDHETGSAGVYVICPISVQVITSFWNLYQGASVQNKDNIDDIQLTVAVMRYMSTSMCITVTHLNTRDTMKTAIATKEHDLSDLFDIALTALAFLSFGLFIVHVIMCISAAHNNATTTAATMMMPMSMSPTATATGGMMTSTGTGGGGMTDTGGGGTDMGMGGGTAGTGMGDGSTGTGDGVISTGTGEVSTGAGGSTGAGTEAGETGTGGGTMGEGTGGGGTGDTGGGANAGGDTTGDASPGTGTGTGTGGGTTGTGGGSTGTGGGTTGTGEGVTGTGGILPLETKKDIPTITNPNNQALNELARRVLISIEAALVANNDDGVCLRKILCENNKFSRNLDGKDKIIIPMWSLGMSWLSGRLVKSISPATSMLDTLKASILGLGKANCEIIYQECDLRRERRERRKRRRRRKRNTT
ncbi:hypothetical protein NQ314_001811 [Rhamnusium bicolor]|uniref:Uncharacterized protein n=1 Tax=Rhamnusium bicolor TaxID=1586634 RepID=A0AAV8ZR98_9CUCU|nr:hypothetical protein NQ314_001811 [Rhamnusium bicolor]